MAEYVIGVHDRIVVKVLIEDTQVVSLPFSYTELLRELCRNRQPDQIKENEQGYQLHKILCQVKAADFPEQDDSSLVKKAVHKIRLQLVFALKGPFRQKEGQPRKPQEIQFTLNKIKSIEELNGLSNKAVADLIQEFIAKEENEISLKEAQIKGDTKSTEESKRTQLEELEKLISRIEDLRKGILKHGRYKY